MKKFFLVLFGCLLALTAEAGDVLNGQKAEQIYDMCDKKIPQVENNGVLSGNVTDVERERLLRKCLKSEIIKIAATMIREKKLENFNKALDGLENNAFMLYKTVLFCKKNDSEEWCHQYYREDTSLDKLMLEKSSTAQIMKVLTDLLEIR